MVNKDELTEMIINTDLEKVPGPKMFGKSILISMMEKF